MLECVMNVSEGRDPAVLDALERAAGSTLLDLHTDVDHHRSVFTLGGAVATVERAARALARDAAHRVRLSGHDGVHPRLGVIDVVPFVALRPETQTIACDAARRYANWSATELGVPVFLYDDADPAHRSLPAVRRDAFARRQPDLGPALPHPQLGATAVGARRPLVAVNCELDRDDFAIARAVASAVRERDGGLPGVRALGLRLASRERTQVSMNLVALERTGLETACAAVRRHARRAGADVARVELVGLLPAEELARCSDTFLAWTGISES
ncbi:MAG: glutamate formiminotransferase, partial [Actinobacteria bacterium]|nr:glutamate formiminotransferase [Actinomycetota bacterium]